MASDSDQRRPDDGKIALVLGGGAPTLTLMAGALLALDEEGVEFDLVSTSGAGMLVGLLYAAPKAGDRRAALKATVDLGVHDDIYRQFPINYKVFYKPGPLAEMWYRAWMPWLEAMPHETSEQRLWRDLAHFWVATMSPSAMTRDSLGMCAPAPWLEQVVDFNRLPAFRPEFFINAYNIRERRMRVFDKQKITAAHFRAALAFPLIYPPFELEGDWYIEGSAMDTLNLQGVVKYDDRYDDAYARFLRAEFVNRWEEIKRYNGYKDLLARNAAMDKLVKEAKQAAHRAALKARLDLEPAREKLNRAREAAASKQDEELRSIKEINAALNRQRKAAKQINAISRVVVFDVLGTDRLVRKPRNLYDAWVLQMIVPLVSISNENIRAFEHEFDYDADDPRKVLHRLAFDAQISHEDWPNVLDWSYSNLKTLFDAGYRSGKQFYKDHDWLQRPRS
jgi:predicted acylesterase/phospholipase RssA